MTELPRIQSFDEFERVAAPIVKPFASQFGAVWFHEAGSKPARRDWLVKDLVLARSFGIVFGPPACGKSFLITDLMLHCAHAALVADEAREWFGYKIHPFGVVYLVAEGADDFVIRLHAWRLEHGIEADKILPFVFLPTSVDLRSDDADTKRLVEEVKGIDMLMREKCGIGVGAVVVDTVSRALAGGNENDSAVMGSFVRNCETIQRQLNVALIGVHHGGKEAGRGPRGHEALLGAADFTWEVSPRTEEEPTNSWAIRKFKGGPAGKQHRFVLRPTDVDTDDEGDPITSCVVLEREGSAGSTPEKDKGYRPNDGELMFLRVLADVIGKEGVPPPAGITPGPDVIAVVNSTAVSQTYKERYRVTEQGSDETIEARLRQRWSRATKKLLTNKIIGSQDGWLWFTGRKIRGVTPRGVTETMSEMLARAQEEAAQSAMDFDIEGL